ncbi:MAG: flagellar M-ring protein FliF [Candidatus Carbobacillus altaicus]|uniref:Flagellar M-ring protein n=1 Tax=Candidatus Carbonibacillus altaicus TaxID=2163959 RepID=A0A2R6Y4Y8_9BACL|nr:flagellar M-ring protein FliF [Candidatus Carbobacillus altaicus]PTQ57728.1 MAG: Flagellar M-ring protein FliF [Candidatus Carbobacillus altaicus]
MRERLLLILENIKTWLAARSTRDKILMMAGGALVLALIIGAMMYVTRTEYVPVFSGLDEREMGEIAARLKEQGIPYKLAAGGGTLYVDKRQAADVKVQMAAEGIPRTGSITYDIFAQNANMGMTDRQFSVLEREALQNELARMIQNGIRGVRKAHVMLTMPEPSIWAHQESDASSASVILDLDPGVRLDQRAIQALYTLISKSVPRLSPDNIVITTQYGELLDPNFGGSTTADDYMRMQEIKRAIERDIEASITRLILTTLPADMTEPPRVSVQAFAQIDFTKETRVEENVRAPEGSDPNDPKGLVLSMEKLSESWQGQGTPPGGNAGTGTTDVPTYQGGNQNNGSYERTEDRINYELDKIHKTVDKAPYALQDLAVNVAVTLPAQAAGNQAMDTTKLTDNIQNAVANIVNLVIENNDAAGQKNANNRVKVIVDVGSLSPAKTPSEQALRWIQDNWFYLALAGFALIVLITGVIFIVRRRRREEDTAPGIAPEFSAYVGEATEPPPLVLEETDEARMQKQLERLAREKPKDFVAILRTWLKEES